MPGYDHLRGRLERELPPEFVAFVKGIKGPRSEIIIRHLLKYGYITTKMLQEKYGYDQPPRAAQDVRDQGVPLETKMVVEDGKRMALYRFADPDRVRRGVTGRKAFPKALKAKMVAKDGEGCGACAAHYEARLLQIDHRIPYGIADAETEANQRVEAFQLLCSSCNRTKSWTCEHGCPNWQVRDPEVCKTCYWFNPSDYLHIATSQRRRITVEWADAQVATFDKLRDDAEKAGMSVPEFVKQRLDRTRV